MKVRLHISHRVVAAFALLTVFGGNGTLAFGKTKRAERVVAIGGAVTEIVFALGQSGRLVARDTTSRFPPKAMELPDVGYIRALSPEGVLSVKPDLILARENSGPPEAVEVLRNAGIRWVDVPDDFTVQGIDENVRIVATALGVDEKGKELRARIAADISDAKRRTSTIVRKKRVLFILSLRDNRIMVSGEKTAADGIIDLAGAQNVMSQFEGYKPVNDEAVVKAQPDVILMMTRHGGTERQQTDEALRKHPALATTPAVNNGKVVRMNGLYLLGFGPRTAQAARDLATAIYGDDIQ